MKFKLNKQLGRFAPGVYDLPESACNNLQKRGHGEAVKEEKSKPETKQQKFEPTRDEMIQTLRDKGERVAHNISNAKLTERYHGA